VNEQLRARLKQGMERIDALQLRERALLFVAVLVVLYLAASRLVFAPLNVEKTRLERQIQAKHTEIQALESQIQAMAAGGVSGADPAKQAQLTTLQERMRVIDTTLARVTSGLVAPKAMAPLVEQVLARSRGLELVRLENLPPTPLEEGPKAVPGTVVTSASGVYKHGLKLELRGEYADLVRYLYALEQMPWKVFWGEVTLATQKAGRSQLTLVLYTLSTQPGWLAI
jgi:MSHA biogenesis protein MshJ